MSGVTTEEEDVTNLSTNKLLSTTIPSKSLLIFIQQKQSRIPPPFISQVHKGFLSRDTKQNKKQPATQPIEEATEEHRRIKTASLIWTDRCSEDEWCPFSVQFWDRTTPSSFLFPQNVHYVSFDAFVRDHCVPTVFHLPKIHSPGEKWSMMSVASGFVDHDSLLS
ncbi:hypothetical protein CDAR_479631 [Caerostris darwini]|uniref:Uncharacterized protein n=1 Tax=Caerostris darwini TaxID=1538125 RepID=A0AAV4T0I0_9ARAC|nr:hypothetical protein CDAR_479631 [Caerostris darwini]